MMKTKFANGVSPWAGTAWERKPVEMTSGKEAKKMTTKPAKKKESIIDPATLKVTNDPIPSVTRSTASKYDAVFNRLTFGHCIVCDPHEAARLGATLVKWLKTKGKPGKVKSLSRYEKDGKGRVWLLEA